MKTLGTIILAIVLNCNLVAAQDTLYIYESSAVLTKLAVNDIDSVIFYISSDPASVTDIDGNEYHTLIIGTQTWMIENLKTTRYNDGTRIPLVTGAYSWTALSTPGYCYFNNDATTNKNTYGVLYNWYTINTGKLAPIGWHVPTDAEWTTLESYLIANGYNYDGTTTGNKIAKSLASTTGWSSSTSTGAIGNDLIKNNTSGFAGLPGGYRSYYPGTFYALGYEGNWWSSTESSTINAWSRYLSRNKSTADRYTNNKLFGFSVRCVRDN